MGLWTLGSGLITTWTRTHRENYNSKSSFGKRKVHYLALLASQSGKATTMRTWIIWAITMELTGTDHLPSHPHHRPGSAGLALFCTTPAYSVEGKGEKGGKIRRVIQAVLTHFAKWLFNHCLLQLEIFITEVANRGRKIKYYFLNSLLPRALIVRRQQVWQPQAASAPTLSQPCVSFHVHFVSTLTQNH